MYYGYYERQEMIKARKKPRIILIIILFIIFVFSLINFIRLNPRIFNSKKYVFSEKACALVFSSNPQKMVDKDIANYFWTDDFCVSAKVDKNNNLVLVMTKEQVQNYRDYMYQYIETVLSFGEIEISSDYKRVTTIEKYENMKNMSYYTYIANVACCAMQFADGVPPEEIDVLDTRIDADTGEIIFQYKYSEQRGKRFVYENGIITLEEAECEF